MNSACSKQTCSCTATLYRLDSLVVEVIKIWITEVRFFNSISFCFLLNNIFFGWSGGGCPPQQQEGQVWPSEKVPVFGVPRAQSVRAGSHTEPTSSAGERGHKDRHADELQDGRWALERGNTCKSRPCLAQASQVAPVTESQHTCAATGMDDTDVGYRKDVKCTKPETVECNNVIWVDWWTYTGRCGYCAFSFLNVYGFILWHWHQCNCYLNELAFRWPTNCLFAAQKVDGCGHWLLPWLDLWPKICGCSGGQSQPGNVQVPDALGSFWVVFTKELRNTHLTVLRMSWRWFSRCLLQHKGQEIIDGLKSALSGRAFYRLPLI